MPATPELSIIIPVLNEALALPPLFATLCSQRDVAMEVIFSDGGSCDDTLSTIVALGSSLPSPPVIVSGTQGRGKQMNRGASASRGRYLLFLHVDSGFENPLALRRALDALQLADAAKGSSLQGGRFRLEFSRSDSAPSFGYYFYAAKARLHRWECIHGDQGLMMCRDTFSRVGGYDETLMINEDNALAHAIGIAEGWVLFPDRIVTSARRFETEGLRQRQTLNAIIMNLLAQDQRKLLTLLPSIYRSHDGCAPLDLSPFFSAIRQYLKGLTLRERNRFWYLTGSYVRNNAWQIAFATDARRAFLKGVDRDLITTPVLDLYDRYLNRLIDHPPGRLITALLTWCWFRLHLLRLLP